MRLILREHANTQISGIDQVGQHEVDQPVVAAERYGRLRAISRQGPQPLALTARKDHAQHPRLHGLTIATCTHTSQSLHADAPIGRDRVAVMRVAVLTKEYPPEVYGGA